MTHDISKKVRNGKAVTLIS